MIKELKFRARVSTTNNTGELVYFSLFDIEKMEKDSNVFSVKNSDLMLLVDTIQQFTNLKDKNGKEIYEGDIVEWHTGHNSIDLAKQEVKWSKEFQQIQPYLQGIVEVIGNIYENKELLK